MATSKKSEAESKNLPSELELRKVRSLERIADSLETLSIWFDDIDKDEWSNRIQHYLAEFHNKFVKGTKGKE